MKHHHYHFWQKGAISLLCLGLFAAPTASGQGEIAKPKSDIHELKYWSTDRPAPMPQQKGRYWPGFFDSYQYRSDIVYDANSVDPNTGRKNPLALNLYLPPEKDKESKRPLVIWIHGGAFRTGDKGGQHHQICSPLAEAGYVSASLSYRLFSSMKKLNGEKYQRGEKRALATEDCLKAIAFLKRNADRFGIDRDRIAVTGYSAGAMISLDIAFKHREPGVKAVSYISGNVDVRTLRADGPPVNIVHGALDETVKFSNSVRFWNRALDIGLPCSFHIYKDVAHSIKDPALKAQGVSMNKLALPTFFSFFQEHLVR